MTSPRSELTPDQQRRVDLALQIAHHRAEAARLEEQMAALRTRRTAPDDPAVGRVR